MFLQIISFVSLSLRRDNSTVPDVGLVLAMEKLNGAEDGNKDGFISLEEFEEGSKRSRKDSRDEL